MIKFIGLIKPGNFGHPDVDRKWVDEIEHYYAIFAPKKAEEGIGMVLQGSETIREFSESFMEVWI